MPKMLLNICKGKYLLLDIKDNKVRRWNLNEICRRLADAKMWVGIHTCQLLHFGATTTQRVEGSHASIKNVLEGKQNIEEVIDRIDMMYRRKVWQLDIHLSQPLHSFTYSRRRR